MPATPRNANTGRPSGPADIGSALLIAAEDYARLVADEEENDRTGYPDDLPHDEQELREARLDLTDRLADLAKIAGPLLKVLAEDRAALDDLAVMLGTKPEWSADELESAANIVGRTERPHPGDAAYSYRREFAMATGRLAPDRYGYDEEDEGHVHYVAELEAPGFHAQMAYSSTRDGIHAAITEARDREARTVVAALYAEHQSGTLDACTCTTHDLVRALAAFTG